MLTLAAAGPILLCVILMTVFSWPAKRAMPLSWLFAAILALFRAPAGDRVSRASNGTYCNRELKSVKGLPAFFLFFQNGTGKEARGTGDGSVERGTVPCSTPFHFLSDKK